MVLRPESPSRIRGENDKGKECVIDMKMLLDGKHVDASDGRTIDIINPATTEFIDTVPLATREDIDRALDCSKAGLEKWKRIPLMEKERIFQRFIALVEDEGNKRDIITLHIQESGFSVRNCLFQYQSIAPLFRGYLESAKRLNGTVFVPGTEKGHSGTTQQDFQFCMYEPIGTVLAVIPFNAPMNLFAYKAASALAAGNAVIAKPPSSNPLAVLKLVELLWEAGVPGDALQCITGSGSSVGKWMVSDPRVNAVTLTGSTEVGVEIAATLAKRLSPCALELGGNDPYIVLADADVEAAVKDGVGWRMNSAGQVCIAPKRFIVHNSVKQRFTELAVKLASGIELAIGMDAKAEVARMLGSDFSALKPGTLRMNCLITEKAAIEVEQQFQKTIAQGAKLLTGGHRHGAFIEPTVLGEVTRDMDVARDMEIFGPVVPIIGFDTVEEAIQIANNSCYGLSGCVMTRDWQLGMHIAQQVETGNFVVNGTGTYRNIMHPFGGLKMSGVGREGLFTLGELVECKTIILKDFLM